MKTKPLAITLAFLSALAIGTLSTILAADEKALTNAADTKAIKTTAQAGMDELKLANLGAQKAERADVKEFANMLVTDHTRMNDELKGLAQSKSVELSASIDAEAADDFKDLEKESGKSFDKAFLDHMISAHKDLISDLEDCEKDAKDGELKAWINQSRPPLKAHLEKAKELNK
jgi:putative membrane protein